MATLQLHSATKTFGKKEVLKNISFSLKTGEILGVFGRNGCGKSTLLKMMFGSLTSGCIEMTVDEATLKPHDNIRKQIIAYLPQHPFVPKNLRVRDAIPIYFFEEKKQDAIFYNPLIAKMASQKISELSLGQLRYFEVLLIGNLDHPFILFDEPFSMIDPLYKIEIKKLLDSLKEKKGIIITDHYYEDVLNIATRNLLIKNGTLYEVNSSEDLRELDYLSSKQLK